MAYDLFKQKAPWIMGKLIEDFDLTVQEAAAIVGNLGHESGGFKFLQELKPLVPGSRGGYGWAQWTGPRRKAFEAWVKRKGFDPASDEANYSYLYRELIGSEKGAIPAVKAAKSLQAKVEAFERAFERAHPQYKHYESRVKYANIALEAWEEKEGKSNDSDPLSTDSGTVGVDQPLPQREQEGGGSSETSGLGSPTSNGSTGSEQSGSSEQQPVRFWVAALRGLGVWLRSRV